MYVLPSKRIFLVVHINEMKTRKNFWIGTFWKQSKKKYLKLILPEHVFVI